MEHRCGLFLRLRCEEADGEPACEPALELPLLLELFGDGGAARSSAISIGEIVEIVEIVETGLPTCRARAQEASGARSAA